MKNEIIIAVLCLVVFIALPACASENKNTVAEPTNKGAPIPTILDEGGLCVLDPNVEAEVTPLSVCDYLMSVDEVVVGYVSEVELVRVPAKVALSGAGTIHDVNDCDGHIHPGLKITLDVEYSRGTITDETVEVYVGYTQLAAWTSMPTESSTGEIVWRNRRGELAEESVAPGQYLGLPIHFHEHDQLWTLMGEQFFDVVDSQNNIAHMKFQGPSQVSCTEIRPSDLDNLSVASLFAHAATCTETNASKGRKRRMASAKDHVERYRGALCIPFDDPGKTP